LEDETRALAALGQALSKARRSAAKKLGEAVSSELKELQMDGAALEIQLHSEPRVEAWSASTGPDSAEFTVRTNPGEPFKPLSKIASGGELSRLTLAIRRVGNEQGQIGVYLFDEIDAGIGGQTAFQVGKKLKAVAGRNQVICITHLAQVASFADRHLNVVKQVKDGRTLTRVELLVEKKRISEIARMLGGPKPSAKSVENAEDLVQMAHKASVILSPRNPRTTKSR
jgi:DNA repair protein RecN (Recombination protein N)